jgi:hypothetical protein
MKRYVLDSFNAFPWLAKIFQEEAARQGVSPSVPASFVQHVGQEDQ